MGPQEWTPSLGCGTPASCDCGPGHSARSSYEHDVQKHFISHYAKRWDYLRVTGLAILFEMTWSDVHVFITLGTLPLSHSLTDAALSQGCKDTNIKKQMIKDTTGKTLKSELLSSLSSNRSVTSRLRVGRMASNILKSFPNRGMSSNRQDGAWLEQGNSAPLCFFFFLI